MPQDVVVQSAELLTSSEQVAAAMGLMVLLIIGAYTIGWAGRQGDRPIRAFDMFIAFVAGGLWALAAAGALLILLYAVTP